MSRPTRSAAAEPDVLGRLAEVLQLPGARLVHPRHRAPAGRGAAPGHPRGDQPDRRGRRRHPARRASPATNPSRARRSAPKRPWPASRPRRRRANGPRSPGSCASGTSCTACRGATSRSSCAAVASSTWCAARSPTPRFRSPRPPVAVGTARRPDGARPAHARRRRHRARAAHRRRSRASCCSARSAASIRSACASCDSRCAPRTSRVAAQRVPTTCSSTRSAARPGSRPSTTASDAPPPSSPRPSQKLRESDGSIEELLWLAWEPQRARRQLARQALGSGVGGGRGEPATSTASSPCSRPRSGSPSAGPTIRLRCSSPNVLDAEVPEDSLSPRSVR